MLWWGPQPSLRPVRPVALAGGSWEQYIRGSGACRILARHENCRSLQLAPSAVTASFRPLQTGCRGGMFRALGCSRARTADTGSLALSLGSGRRIVRGGLSLSRRCWVPAAAQAGLGLGRADALTGTTAGGSCLSAQVKPVPDLG